MPIIRRRVEPVTHMDFSGSRKLEESVHFTPLTSGPLNIIAEKSVSLTNQVQPMADTANTFTTDPNLTGFSRTSNQPVPG